MTDYEKMREDLARKTMKELRAIARDEGICLGYDGARKDSTVAAIVGQRKHREMKYREMMGLDERDA
jgi:hypothetical protein